jgi:hypothetical protein
MLVIYSGAWPTRRHTHRDSTYDKPSVNQPINKLHFLQVVFFFFLILCVIWTKYTKWNVSRLSTRPHVSSPVPTGCLHYMKLKSNYQTTFIKRMPHCTMNWQLQASSTYITFILKTDSFYDMVHIESHVSSVGIATGWTIGVLVFDSRRGLGIFLFTTASRTALGPTQPPIQWVPGSLSLGVRRPGREADHSPSSAKVKEWVELYLHSPNTPSWRGAQLKQRDYFTFTLPLKCTFNETQRTTLSWLGVVRYRLYD